MSEEIMDLLRRTKYEDGFLYWTCSPRPGWNGKKVGSPDKHGYLRAKVLGKTILIHRAIFMLFYGYLPRYIDHIDGDPKNNNFLNLREATASQNQMNSKVVKDSSAGVKGVHVHIKLSKFVASIKIQGKTLSLGCFEDRFEAICARKSAEITHHNGFYRGSGAVARLNGIEP